MKIPSENIERQTFIHDVLTRCTASQEDRKEAYRTLKQMYLFGCDSESEIQGTVNKIWPHVDQTVSFLYAQDTTRFNIELSKSVPESEYGKVPALDEAVNDTWHSSNTDIIYGDALTWSHVYGSMFVKARWHTSYIAPDVVEPHNFGVWREDVMGLENQEAFSHTYLIPKQQLLYELTVANHPSAQRIVDEAVANEEQKDDQTAQPIDRIITSSAMPVVMGQLNQTLGVRIQYKPKLAQPMVRMHELYVYDDEIKDFTVFTLAHPGVIVYDRPISKLYLPNKIPFVQVCPFPMHDYFWGMSAVERLIVLQQMRNRRWDQVQHMMELQASPPSYATGFEGSADDIQDAMDTPNGLVVSDNPGGKAEKLQTTIPDDLFAEITYIDTQFDEALGTTPIMSGQGASGVRSESHASQLLRVGASRAKRRAMVVEDSLEELATLYLHLLQKYSAARYRDELTETEFTASQFTDDFVVRVDAHSNSPLFMQDSRETALLLFKAKAIDRTELLDLLQVPMKDLLKIKLKTKIEPAEAAAAKQEQAAIAAGQKVTKIGGKSK